MKALAAIGIDMQNDFCPGGSLAVENGDRVIPAFNRVAEWVRKNQGVVTFTADWHPPQTDHFTQWPVHCVENSQGAAFHPDLAVQHQDYVLRKGMDPHEDAYSGFQAVTADNQPLEHLVAPRHKVKALLIGGLATDYCVRATVLDACNKAKAWQFADIYVVEDAIAAVNLMPHDELCAKTEMERAGARFIKSEDILNGTAMELAR